MPKLKPSKSAKKREFTALQVLGEELIGLTSEQLKSIGLEESLLDAVLTAKSTTSHGALRRQKQLIGKMMRHEDPVPIRDALQAFGSNDRVEKDIFRRAEFWRDRIAVEGHAVLAEYCKMLGYDNQNLATISKSLDTAPNDRIIRELRRELFREIHRDLALRMRSDTI